MILQLTTSANVASQRNGDILFLAFKLKTHSQVILMTALYTRNKKPDCLFNRKVWLVYSELLHEITTIKGYNVT